MSFGGEIMATSTHNASNTRQAWARGGTVLAATLLLLIGVFQFFVGIAALAQNNFFVVGANYTYEIDTTAWGWIHVAIGVVAALTGFFLFTGTAWARGIAIAVAAISAIANFFFLPYYPLWSLLIIGVDIFAIWAIASVRPAKEYEAAMTGQMQGSGYLGGTQTGQMQGGQMQGDWPAGNQGATGRHWAPDNVKEGTPQAGPSTPAEAQQRAEAAARGGMSYPPNNPNNPSGG